MAAFEESMSSHNSYLGPLAFKYSKKMLVYISLNVLLEFAFVANKLNCFMYKLNVCPSTTLICKKKNNHTIHTEMKFLNV